MLDHDLDMQARVASDLKISGAAVVQELITHFHRDIPIPVHSMHPGGAPRMVKQLQSVGFPITTVEGIAQQPARRRDESRLVFLLPRRLW